MLVCTTTCCRRQAAYGSGSLLLFSSCRQSCVLCAWFRPCSVFVDHRSKMGLIEQRETRRMRCSPQDLNGCTIQMPFVVHTPLARCILLVVSDAWFRPLYQVVGPIGAWQDGSRGQTHHRGDPQLASGVGARAPDLARLQPSCLYSQSRPFRN